MEMLHHMMKYPEVITDLAFVTIQTTPLEFRAGVELENSTAVPTEKAPDGAHAGSLSDDIRKSKNLPVWRQHSENEMRIYYDLTQSKVSIDKITAFSLRPPELRYLFNKTGQYFRWFSVQKSKIDDGKIDEKLKVDIEESIWVNMLQQQIRVRKRAFPEIIKYINSNHAADDDNDNGVETMKELFQKMNTFIQSPDNTHVSIEDHAFITFMNKNLIDSDDETQLLPVPVFSYVKPTLSVQFLHHILLSMGSFETEIDLIMHDSIRESFRYAKLIGSSNDPSDLQVYSNNLLYRYIEDQLQYFPNSKRVLTEWITIAGDLFDSVILRNEISISDMPPVQLSSLFGSSEESIREYCQTKKGIFYDAIKLELEDSMALCNVPSKDDIFAATKSDPLSWDAVDNMQQNRHQSDASFTEQKLAVQTCCDAIDKYANVIDQTSMTKNIGIRGFPGSGKTWCSLYVASYAMSKGLFTLPTALLSKRAIQLGGIHWHKLFCIPTERNMNNHRKAELAIIQILRKPKTLQLLLCLDVLICDEMGQLSADFLAVVDIILRRLRENSLYLGGLLAICTLDHLQIQSIERRPFLISTHIISCFLMVELKIWCEPVTTQTFKEFKS